MEDQTLSQSTPGTAGIADANQLRQYWHTILERRWLILTALTVVVILGVVYAFKSTPIYEAVARLQIDPEAGSVLGARDGLSWNRQDQEYLQTQYRNLQSRSLIEAVIAKLKLDADPRYAEKQDKVKAVLSDIQISPVRLTRLVEVKARHPNSQVAADMANTLTDLFITRNQDLKSKKAIAGYNMLKAEAQSQETELLSAIEALQKYRVEKGMISLVEDLKQGENIDAQALRNARQDLDTQTSRAAELQKLTDEGNKWIKDGKDVADFYGVNQDKLVTELKARLATSESALSMLRTRYRDRHPKMIEALNSLQTDREKLKLEAQRAFDAILTSYQVEKAREDQARVRYREAEKRITELNAARTKFDVLTRQKERSEFMYQQVLAKMREYDLNSKDTSQNMAIIDDAEPQPKPVKPNKTLILAGSLVGGLAFALGLAFFVSFLDDSIKSQEDVENILRLPFLGYIPNIKSANIVERDLQAHHEPTSGTAEGFRTLRAAIALAKNADKLRCIAVTSTIPSEGKSLVASNLAIVMAQTGLKTLLVDADLRRPSVHKAFQLQSPIGLSAYLAERVRSVSEIAHPTEVPNLDVICCGAIPTNPSELIGSKRMFQFLEEVSQKYDRVILDCPPISAVADPLVIGSMSDGILFVTKFNKIRREHAQRSVQRIQDAGIHIIGLVLNDIDFEGKDSYYYSYYYYQNRYYSSHYRSRTGGDEGGKKGKGEGKKVES
jgi:succinoglycan biosynthesis transport protein ExoP